MEYAKEIDPIESFLQIAVEIVLPVVLQMICHDAAVPKCSAAASLTRSSL